jgi:hypothetical protein
VFTVALSSDVVNADGLPVEGPRQWSVEVGGQVFYVNLLLFGDGSRPEQAMCCIQDAIVEASQKSPNADVLVARGAYPSFTPLEGVGVFGGFNSDFTIRNPQTITSAIVEAEGVVISTDGLDHNDDAVIDGFRILSSAQAPTATVVLSDQSRLTLSNNDIRRDGAESANVALTVSGSGPLIIENHIRAEGGDATAVDVSSAAGADDRPRLYYNVIQAESETSPSDAFALVISAPDVTTEVVGNLIGAGRASSNATGIVLEARAEVFNNLISAVGPAATCRGIRISGGEGLIAHNIINGGACDVETVAVALLDPPDVSLVNNILFTSGRGSSVDAGVFETEYLSDPLAFRNNLIFDVDVLYADEQGEAEMTDIGAVNSDLDVTVDRAACAGACETGRVGGNITTDATPAELFADYRGPDTLLSTLEDNDWRYDLTDVAEVGLDTGGAECGTIESPTDCGGVVTDADGARRTVPTSVGAYEYEIGCP